MGGVLLVAPASYSYLVRWVGGWGCRNRNWRIKRISSIMLLRLSWAFLSMLELIRFSMLSSLSLINSVTGRVDAKEAEELCYFFDQITLSILCDHNSARVDPLLGALIPFTAKIDRWMSGCERNGSISRTSSIRSIRLSCVFLIMQELTRAFMLSSLTAKHRSFLLSFHCIRSFRPWWDLSLFTERIYQQHSFTKLL